MTVEFKCIDRVEKRCGCDDLLFVDSLSFSHFHSDSYSNNNMRPDPQVHDEILGVPVGTLFADRGDAYKSGVHGVTEAGIFGTKDLGGAFSIVINGTYVDDVDEGDKIIFTGEGRGKAPVVPGEEVSTGILVGFAHPFVLQPKKSKSNVQVGDQDPNSRGNKALRENIRTRNPVRVIRGPEGNPKYCPVQGYRYDGLYEVTHFEMKEGREGFKMCMFTVERCTSFTQLDLPLHITGLGGHDIFWSPDRDCAGETLNRRIPAKGTRGITKASTKTKIGPIRASIGRRIRDLKMSRRSSL
ncbi:YDG domain-containing protein [Mycena indigotica]|uniref:YDG domain-containing protein n=1 Tax=Mycena indigotica TaxID=2126181 RepID=A0A8H6RYY3_9AGAR|nr:YDG domain-containing protein [Mycena indigotica]KAF7289894.1 YDG domain-containing protein [Mycena indigotica]